MLPMVLMLSSPCRRMGCLAACRAGLDLTVMGSGASTSLLVTRL